MGATCRIGNGAGFWGDQPDAPRWLAELGNLDYLTLEYLAELTMSILAHLRSKNPQAGFATDFLEVLPRLTPVLSSQPRLKILTNAGGMNPLACARAAAQVLGPAGLASLPLGVVSGDDLLPRLGELRALGWDFPHFDTGEPLSERAARVVSVNAYLGAQPLAEALDQNARLVVTGRVADASLTLAPAVAEFGWDWQEWDRLAGASIAGHLIECGAQVTGGLSPDWDLHDPAGMGYPIAEVAMDGSCVLTKPDETGGIVNRRTVIQQLVYEIGDPARYLTPDVVVDFTTIEVEEQGKNRVAVRGGTGRPAPDSYKVSLAYRAGYTASAQLLVYGRDCVAKARACAALVRDRCARAGFELDSLHLEALGAGASVPGLHEPPTGLREVMLRLTARDSRKEAVERFTREIAPLITSGPPGLAGYASGRASVRPVLAYWPTRIPRDLVTARVEVRPVRDWLTSG